MAQWVAEHFKQVAKPAKQALYRLFHSEDLTYASCIAYYSLIPLFPLMMFAVLFLSIHGSLTTTIAFLLWVYVLAVIFLSEVDFSAAWTRLSQRIDPALYP